MFATQTTQLNHLYNQHRDLYCPLTFNREMLLSGSMGFFHSSRYWFGRLVWSKTLWAFVFFITVTMHTIPRHYLIACSLFQGWNSDHIVQFMNITSQAGNKLDCWHCLYHPSSLDAKFSGSAKPVSETSWCQPNLAYLFPNIPNYQQQPLKHFHMLSIVHYSDPGHRFNLGEEESNYNYSLCYNHTQT